MKFSEVLFESTRDIWSDYLKHPFIVEIANGNLDKIKFEKYLVQDYLYLKEYSRVFAMGMVKAETMEEIKFFYSSVKATMEDENEYHVKYLRNLGYKLTELEKMKEESENSNYTAYMKSISLTGGVEEIAVAILPCTWSYSYIGRYIMDNYKGKLEDNPFRGWIEMYADNGFAEFTDRWINYIDDLCSDISDSKKKKLIEIFIECSKHEMNFWDMSYNFKGDN